MKKLALIFMLATLTAVANAKAVVFEVPDAWMGNVRGRVIPVQGFFFNGDNWFSSATYGDNPGRPIAMLPDAAFTTIGYRGSYTFTGLTMAYGPYEGAPDLGPGHADFQLLDASGKLLASFDAVLNYGDGFQTFGSMVNNVSTIRFLRSDLTPRIESIGMQSAITAVPEPSSSLMMLGGLGLIAVSALRKRKRDSMALLRTPSMS
jgi:hypothetical protein